MIVSCRVVALSWLVGANLVGCAYWQSIRLPVNAVADEALARVVVEDARPPEDDRKTHMGGAGKCARIYGDGFIEPSKIEYLRSNLAERLPPTSKVVIRLERFDSIEHCELTVRRIKRSAQAAAVAGATHGVVVSMGATPTGSGDEFELHIAGTANGVPFQFHRSFDYSDVRFLNFPSDNEEYRARIGKLFAAFFDEMTQLLGAAPQEKAMRTDDRRAAIATR